MRAVGNQILWRSDPSTKTIQQKLISCCKNHFNTFRFITQLTGSHKHTERLFNYLKTKQCSGDFLGFGWQLSSWINVFCQLAQRNSSLKSAGTLFLNCRLIQTHSGLVWTLHHLFISVFNRSFSTIQGHQKLTLLTWLKSEKAKIQQIW